MFLHYLAKATNAEIASFLSKRELWLCSFSCELMKPVDDKICSVTTAVYDGRLKNL